MPYLCIVSERDKSTLLSPKPPDTLVMRTNLYGTAKQENTCTPKSYKTVEDVTVNFKTYGNITIPKGTLVTNKTACGYDDNYAFVSEFGWIRENYKSFHMLLEFDAKNYGIKIPKDKLIRID